MLGFAQRSIVRPAGETVRGKSFNARTQWNKDARFFYFLCVLAACVDSKMFEMLLTTTNLAARPNT